MTIVISDPALPIPGSKTINYTVQTGNTINTIAYNLAAAVTADTDLQQAGINATAEARLGSTTVSAIYLRSVSSNITTYTTSKSAGATEVFGKCSYWNAFTNVLLGGTPTAGDTVNVTVKNASLTGGAQTATYTVVGGTRFTALL